MWLPWSSGAEVDTIAAGVVFRFLIPSIAEGATVLDRNIQEYTTLRTILNLQLSVGSGFNIVTCGIILASRDITATLLNPAGDPTAAWLWHEEFLVKGADNSDIIHRDVLGKRKSSAFGLQNEMYAYIENRSAAGTVSFHYSGRTLVLL